MALTDYCSVDELQNYAFPGIMLASGVSAESTLYGLAITAASRAIDTATNRYFGLSDGIETRYYTPVRSMKHQTMTSPLFVMPLNLYEYGSYYQDSGRYAVKIDDITTVSGMVIASDYSQNDTWSTSITDYQLTPMNALKDNMAYTHVRFKWGAKVSKYPDSVAVTAKFGWESVPDDIKQIGRASCRERV